MQRMHRLLARVRDVDPFRLDVALAVMLTAGILAEAAFLHADGGRWPTAVAGALATVSIAWRRTHAVAIVIWMSIVLQAGDLAGGFLTTSDPGTTSPFLALLVMAYSLGRWYRGRTMWIGTAWVITTLCVTVVLAGGRPEQAMSGLVLFGLPVIAGAAMRRRARIREQLIARTEALEAEGDARARRAVDAERDRIAAELQAIVANGVSAMVVQAEAVPKALERGDHVAAGGMLERIEETGRDALGETRRMLGVLRRDDDRALRAPQPSLAQAEALVGEMSGDGFVVSLRIEGDRSALAAGLDLAAYRVIQVALGSSSTGGATSAGVEIGYEPRAVTLVVRDDRTGEPISAADVRAIRERVDLYGGSMRAGAEGDGHRVWARLPREAER